MLFLTKFVNVDQWTCFFKHWRKTESCFNEVHSMFAYRSKTFENAWLMSQFCFKMMIRFSLYFSISYDTFLSQICSSCSCILKIRSSFVGKSISNHQKLFAIMKKVKTVIRQELFIMNINWVFWKVFAVGEVRRKGNSKSFPKSKTFQ